METAPWRLLGRFNNQVQLLVILLLSMLILLIHFLPDWNFVLVIGDIVVVFSILRLSGGYFWRIFNNLQNLRVEVVSWMDNAERQRIVSLARETLSWIAILFLLLWLSRWLYGSDVALELSGSRHYLNYIDTALATFLLSTVLNSSRLAPFFARLDLSSGRRMMLLYFIAALVGTYILMLPFSLSDGASLKLIDSFFITVSALAVTGLSTINIAEILSLPGQWVLLGLIQIGGLGIVIVTSGLALAAVKRLSIRGTLVNREIYDIPDLGNMTLFLRKVVAFTLAAEFVGTIILYFSLPSNMPDRFHHAVFHSISAFCNAGFSSLPLSLESSPFGILGIWSICLLVIIGGLGFPVLFELINRSRKTKKYFRFSANTRLSLQVSGVLLILGAVLFFLLESVVKVPTLSAFERFGQALFYTVSTRTAGFNMVPVDRFHISTILVMMGLMIIGGSPISAAGGLKTTTIGVLFAAALSSIRGQRAAQYHHREIPNSVVMRAISAVVLYFVAAIGASLLLFVTEDTDSWALIFEIVSALSTVGLSLGATPHLSFFGKLIIILLMIVGRLGLVTAAYAGLGRQEEQRFRYPEDKFFAG